MGRSRKPPEYKPHPLLEELRPPLKETARRSLLKSMERVGQLSEILVTADGYILDGRTRLELAKELNTQPRIRYLTMHSCVGEVPPGYDRDWEMEQVRDVIEETGRGKWKDSPARRETENTTENTNRTESTAENTNRTENTTERVLNYVLANGPVNKSEISLDLDLKVTDELLQRLVFSNRIRVIDTISGKRGGRAHLYGPPL